MPNQTVDSRDAHQVIITLTDGSTLILGGSEETVTMDAQGGTITTKTDHRVATLDGYILDPTRGDIAFQCGNCQTGPWSRYAMGRCLACRHLICTGCLHQTDNGLVCDVCYKLQQRKGRIAFLCSIR